MMQTYDCPVDGCTECRIHPLLVDNHVVNEHEEWLDSLIDGTRNVGGI